VKNKKSQKAGCDYEITITIAVILILYPFRVYDNPEEECK
jgi:hypothetical protein